MGFKRKIIKYILYVFVLLGTFSFTYPSKKCNLVIPNIFNNEINCNLTYTTVCFKQASWKQKELYRDSYGGDDIYYEINYKPRKKGPLLHCRLSLNNNDVDETIKTLSLLARKIEIENYPTFDLIKYNLNNTDSSISGIFILKPLNCLEGDQWSLLLDFSSNNHLSSNQINDIILIAKSIKITNY